MNKTAIFVFTEGMTCYTAVKNGIISPNPRSKMDKYFADIAMDDVDIFFSYICMKKKIQSSISHSFICTDTASKFCILDHPEKHYLCMTCFSTE